MGESKLTDERYTPQHVLNVVREFAPIALDPCTTADNPTGAERWIVKAQDGLTWPWDKPGLVYVNPPYSRGLVDKWARQTAFRSVGCDEVMLLVPADMSTRWSKFLLANAHAVAMFDKRLKFYKPDGRFDSGAKFGNAMYYWGERVERFRRVFQPHATVLNLRAAR